MGAFTTNRMSTMQALKPESSSPENPRCLEILEEMGFHGYCTLSMAFRFLWKGLVYPDERLDYVQCAQYCLTKWLENNGGVQ